MHATFPDYITDLLITSYLAKSTSHEAPDYATFFNLLLLLSLGSKILTRVGGVRVTKITGSSSDDWIFSTSVTSSFNYN
jgi:hypothetical protein